MVNSRARFPIAAFDLYPKKNVRRNKVSYKLYYWLQFRYMKT